MDVLLRSKCHHEHASDTRCLECQGAGYIERWVPMDLLKVLPNANWIIVAYKRGTS
jgi:hypothetical protein